MATISIDYDSNGDVELILEEKDNTPLNQAAQQASLSSEEEKLAKYNMGPLSVKVKEVRLRVSSLKLISSSRYFQAMLEGSSFREGAELKEHGFVEIKLLDLEDEPKAMMIILGILYGNNVQVPLEIDLPTLEKLAVLVDKYQWHTLVTPYATSWFDSLSNSQSLPDAFDKALSTRLFIAWLFGMRDHFKALSRVAQLDACNSIDLTDESIRLSARALNIALEVVKEVPRHPFAEVMLTAPPSPIYLSQRFRIEAINEQRDVAFRKIEQVLEAFKRRMLDDEAQKNEDPGPASQMLRYMVFGFATFCSKDLGLGEFAAPDHAGSSIRSLRNRINLSQSMEGFQVKGPNIGEWQVIPGRHWDLKSKLQRAITDLKMDEWGLDYDDFKPSLVNNRPNEVPGLE